MEWHKEKKYRRIEDISKEEFELLVSRVNSCPWRQAYHIQPISGLLNDPNGFSFYNGEYHLFYQWHPLGPVHGLKYWYHSKSKDLVHWENVGIALKPDTYFDSHGVYSGSAIKHDGKLYLLYTGNTYDKNLERHPYQCIAVMDEHENISKLEKPFVKEVPEGYTEHFRDPKVWKEGEKFYAIIGAQRIDKTGCTVLYSSKNLLEWIFEGEIWTNLNPFGYMWECPDYFEIENRGIITFSPQGLKPLEDKYKNIYQSGYILGEKLDLKQKLFKHGEFTELDRGFDFYAPQTMKDPDGRRILIGWMGLPEMEYPTDKNGWAHCLTLPRELSIKNSKVIQKPIRELQTLRKKEVKISDGIFNEVKMYDGFSGITYELICEFEYEDGSEFGIIFRGNEEEKTVIKYDSAQKKVILDRTLSGKEVAVEYGSERACEIYADKIKFHLFVDCSSVEIFVNDGEEVFTARIFPNQNSKDIRFFAMKAPAKFKAVKWNY
jgi:beta-fructofuranosidase